MKVKVKGLVFVGFAAAVFATSAMAADGDGKIVTSKLYVDNKIAATATINYGGSDHANTSTNNTAVTGTGTVGTVKYTKISNDSSDIDATAGENVLVTGKAVAGAIEDLSNDISSINVDGDEEYITVTDGTGNDAGTFTVGPKNTPASTSTGITGTLTNNIPAALTDAEQKTLVTAAAVKDLVEFETSAGTTKITSSSTNGKVPTSKSVYDFVTKGKHYQPKAPTTDGTSLYLGHNTQSTSGGTTTNTADWKKLEAVASANTQPTTDYVTIMEDSGVYKINIPTAQLTSATTDFTGTVTNGVWGGPSATQKAKLVKAETINSLINKETIVGTTTITDAAAGNTTVPTSKNVYDFVTNAVSTAGAGYQPKISDTSYDKVMIGYNKRSGNATDGYTFDSNWQVLDSGTYVEPTSDGTATTIDIKSGQLTSATTDFTGTVNTTTGVWGGPSATQKAKLVKAETINLLIDKETAQNTTTISSAVAGNAKVPTSKNVYDFVDSNKLKAGSTTGGTIGSNSSDDSKVPTSKNVYQFVDSNKLKAGSTTGGTIGSNTTDDSKVPTVKNVVEYVTGLTGGLTIPVPTGDCAYGTNGITSSNGVACALVLAYDANAGGTGVAGVSLQWIPMAQ